MPPVAAGKQAPDFTLRRTPDQAVSLRDFRGQPVILMFYPADWSPVCGDQVVLFNQLLDEFKRSNAALLGVSVDGAWCHMAFALDRKLQYWLLSDFEPKGDVARSYGSIGVRTASASARSSSSTRRESSAGTTYRPSASTRAPMGC